MDKDARIKAYDKGVWSEELAVQMLEKKGYDILQQRYKSRFGEVDIVALKGDALVFVEVKARKNLGDALEAVHYRTRRRIEQAALYFISMNEEYGSHCMRFDVIAVAGVDKFGDMSVRHLDNAWEAGQ